MALATSIAVTAAAGILLLGFIVFIHELGHFAVAKACGVRVLTFSLGFGPRLFGFRVGDTEYRLSLLPLGGYVRMFGDDITEDISDEEKRYSFLHQPIPARMAIAAAGPIANFILPVVLFGLFNLGAHQVAAPVVGTVLPSEPAAKAGLRPGDTVKSVDSVAVSDFGDVQSYVTARPGQAITFVVDRDGVEKTFKVTPRAVRGGNPLSMADEKGRVGIVTSHRLPRVHVSQQLAKQGANIATGDLVKSVNGTEVASYEAFQTAVQQVPTTEALTLSVEKVAPPGPKDTAPDLVTVVLPARALGALSEADRKEDSDSPARDAESGASGNSATNGDTPGDAATDDDDDDDDTADDGTTDNSATGANRKVAAGPAITLIQQAVTRDELNFRPTAEAVAKTRKRLVEATAFLERSRGLSTLEGVVVEVQANTTAAAVGLSPGDRIVSIDGHPLTHSGELQTRLFEGPEAVHVVGVIRGAPLKKATPSTKGAASKGVNDAKNEPNQTAPPTDAKSNATVGPDLRIVVFRMLPAPQWGMEDFRIFGVQAATAYGAPPLVDKDVGITEALAMAVEQTGELFRDTILGIGKLVTGQLSLRSMGGPITIFNLAGQAAERGAGDFIFLMAFISINLGIVNLLPVPVLDGGHLLLFTIEGIRRKRMSLEAQEKLLKVGLGLLAALMILAFFNDVMRLL